MPTILTWRLGALGDTLLLLPALAALRAAFPAHTLVAAGDPAALAPARWHGLVDGVLDAGAGALAPLSLGEPPAPGALPPDIEVAIVWSARGDTIARALARAGVRRVLIAPILPAAAASREDRGSEADQVPVAEHYLAALAPLGVRPVPFALRAPAAARAATEQFWRDATAASLTTPPTSAGTPVAPVAPVVLLHPGAGSPTKRWPLAHYQGLARRLRDDGAAVVWTAGPADADIRALLESGDERSRVLPPLDVARLAAVVERAAVVVSGDCGIAHLAALLGVHSVALFGPTSPHAWGPPSERCTVVRLAVSCAPCGGVAPQCPSRICLRGLPVDAVRRAVRAGIERWRNAEDEAPSTGRVGRGGRPSPSRPADYHPPATASAPPGALHVGVWGSPDRWVRHPSTGPG